MEKGIVYCVLTTILLLQSGLIIPSLYYGFVEEDSACQQGTRGGLNLSDWLKGFGFEKVALNGLMILSAFLVITVNKLETLILPVVVMVLDTLFNFAWWIWGVVILATSENNHCVAEGKGMAVMAIIDLVLSAVWFLHIKVLLMFRENT